MKKNMKKNTDLKNTDKKSNISADSNSEIKMFIYYSVGTGHDSDDVAITSANTIEQAIEYFKLYFNNASYDNVQLIDLYRKGYVQNMMIVSMY